MRRAARAVRDELEQALYSLPRISAADNRIALLIEEAIERAMEMELSRAHQSDEGRPASRR